MTPRRHRTASLLLLLSLAACGTTEPGLEQVTVSGTVTSAGQPVTGNGIVTLGVTRGGTTVRTIPVTLDGTYAISGEVESTDCCSLFVSIFVTDLFGRIDGFATEKLGSCGTHVVDLVVG